MFALDRWHDFALDDEKLSSSSRVASSRSKSAGFKFSELVREFRNSIVSVNISLVISSFSEIEGHDEGAP